MIKVFYGEDRVRARRMIDKLLGDGMEVIDSENLSVGDMPSIFLGASLFGDKRSILIKDLSDNKECWDALPKFTADCTHDVIVWENKLDKRSVTYKALSKDKSIEFKEFALAEDPNKGLVFEIFDTAFSGNGAGAIKKCEAIELTNDPYMFMGLMVTQGIKKLQFNNAKAAKVLKILAQADIDMKSATLEPWTVIKMALLKISEKA